MLHLTSGPVLSAVSDNRFTVKTKPQVHLRIMGFLASTDAVVEDCSQELNLKNVAAVQAFLAAGCSFFCTRNCTFTFLQFLHRVNS